MVIARRLDLQSLLGWTQGANCGRPISKACLNLMCSTNTNFESMVARSPHGARQLCWGLHGEPAGTASGSRTFRAEAPRENNDGRKWVILQTSFIETDGLYCRNVSFPSGQQLCAHQRQPPSSASQRAPVTLSECPVKLCAPEES